MEIAPNNCVQQNMDNLSYSMKHESEIGYKQAISCFNSNGCRSGNTIRPVYHTSYCSPDDPDCKPKHIPTRRGIKPMLGQ